MGTNTFLLYLLPSQHLRAQSKFCWDLYFSQKPDFKNTETSKQASIQGKICPGLAISYTWPLKKYTRYNLAQRFTAGTFVNLIKVHTEKEFIADGYETTWHVPLFSPFISWGILGKRVILNTPKLKIEAFLTPRASFFIPTDQPASLVPITASGSYEIFHLLGIMGIPVRPIPSIEAGFEWIFKKERKHMSSLAISYSFSGFTVGKGKYNFDGTTEHVRGSYKYKANSLIIGINKRY